LKKRDELLEAYEALDAQLSSALQQLSWTLALRAPRSYEHASNESAINAGFASPLAAAEPLWSASQRIDPMNANQSDTLHIMVIVGTSLNAPKARIFLLLHNFEIRPFGWREDAVAAEPTTSNGANGSDDNPEEDELNELAEQMASTSLASGTSYEDDEASESSEEEYIETSVADSSFDSAEDPSAIRAPTIPHDSDPHDDDDDDDDAFEEYEVLSIPSSSAEASPFDAVSRASDGSVTIHVAHGPSQTPSADFKNAISHSANIPETQQPSSSPKHISTSSEAFIRKVERLIYRTLAVPPSSGNVAAEDEELPLSQTNVLIRAPRRFKHASFLPRQTYSKELDEALSQCLSPPSYLNVKGAKSTSRGRALGGKAKTEGIRVSCDKAAAAEAARCRVGRSGGESGGTLDDGCEGLDAEDEMIWWQWTGKLRGIGDEVFGY